MRVATSTMTQLATSSMGKSYETYADIINKITSNRNFSTVSENVYDATRVLKLKDQLAKLDEYQSNINAALNEMDYTYDTLGAITDEINAINSLVVEASNATTTREAAKAIGIEIEQRINTIADKMNAKYLDNYIFSGTFTNNQTYIDDGNGNIKYNGSSQKAGDRNLTISEGSTISYNITAEEIFGKEDAKDADGNLTNFFAQMKELSEALMDDNETVDYDKIRGKLTVLQDTATNITQAQGKLAAKSTKLDTTKSINESTIADLTEEKVGLEEVDITKAATDLANAQTALQASYLIGTNVLSSVSLLDYL